MFEYQKLLLLSHQHYGMLASDEWMHSRGVIFIFLPSLSSVISRNTECAVWESCSYSDNGIGWHSWCSRNSRDADFVSFYFPFFFFFFLPSYGDVGEQVLCSGCSIFQIWILMKWPLWLAEMFVHFMKSPSCRWPINPFSMWINYRISMFYIFILYFFLL